MEEAYKALKAADSEAAKRYLSDYTLQQTYKARQWTDEVLTHFADDTWRDTLYDEVYD